ncbi:MAG: Ku protein [Planctomycetota bacterium]|nr:MAG: Ku protein [Planctomycetota bacterium]
MPRPVWKGHISFGLVNVPIVLYSAETRADLSFKLLDSRNAARVRYERVNEETGEEVPWDKIVKGFEYENGSYVLLSEGELENASAELTRTIEIEQFVELSLIDLRYFDRPYILAPGAKGEKGYVLLRQAIAQAGKAGVCRVVIRARQYLAALVVEGDALILELLRYAQELRPLEEFDLPDQDLRKYKVSKQEIDLAAKLIEGMSGDWDPAQYHDEYRHALMELIERKINSGQTQAVEHYEEAPEQEEAPPAINFMEVLRRSVEHASGKRATGGKAAKKKAPPKKKAAKKRRAG